MTLPLILLAAGTSSRTRAEGGHKLLATRHGVPLIRQVALAALATVLRPVVVVTGAEHEAMAEALSGLPVLRLYHAGYEGGIGGSLAAGIGAVLARRPLGVVVMLADMPLITAANIEAVVAAFATSDGGVLVRAYADGLPGHPVLLPARLLPELASLRGHNGARALLARSGLPELRVEIGPAALTDADTVPALAALGYFSAS